MVVFAMPETSIEVAITDAFSLISDWLNRELYDKAKLDELPILFFELTWLMNRARHILGDYQQERLHFEPIIASVSEWMANTQQTNKISPLTQAAIEQLQRIGDVPLFEIIALEGGDRAGQLFFRGGTVPDHDYVVHRRD